MIKYFGTDGIRGKAYEFISEHLAYQVGLALQVLENDKLIIGRDTRESGLALATKIIEGAKEVGIRAYDVGVVSTPMLSYLSKCFDSLGVMITASHNPHTDNGIKIFKVGKKIFSKEEADIEGVLNGIVPVTKNKIEEANLIPFDPIDLYLKLFKQIIMRTNMKIGLDFANGATYEIGKIIFSKISSNLEFIGDKPNGKNINENVGATNLNALFNLIQEKQLDLGFAFDGDGDRIMVVDSIGKIYDGDLLIYIFAVYLKEQGLLKGNAVVLTKMSNLGIVKALREQGINVIWADVGDKYVLETLETNNLILGGENSGHIINLLLLDTGDGLLNAVYLVKVIVDSGKSLEELTRGVILYPNQTYNLNNVNKKMVNHEAVLARIDLLRKRLGEDGKIIVRASGTEPVIRITVSASTLSEVDEIIDDIVKTILENSN